MSADRHALMTELFETVSYVNEYRDGPLPVVEDDDEDEDDDPPPLAAAGNDYKEWEHPRGRDGQWINKLGWVKVFKDRDSSEEPRIGKVMDTTPDGVVVEFKGGGRTTVTPDRIEESEGKARLDSPVPTSQVSRFDTTSVKTFINEDLKMKVAAGIQDTEAQRERDFSFSQVVNDADVYVRVWDDVLAKILTEGRFKTQFETGESGGIFDASQRSNIERDLYGHAEDASATSRPIYGYMDSGTAGPGRLGDFELEQYGNIAVKLKSSTRTRTTYTATDSLEGYLDDEKNRRATFIPGLLDDVPPLGLAGPYGVSEQMPDAIDDNLILGFVEAQIHGGVSVSDIAEVHLSDDVDNPELVQALQALGITVFINGKAQT